MKTQGRVVLVLAFFAALGGLWLADRVKVPDRDKRRLADLHVLPELVDARPDDLRRIEILGGPETVVLERAGERNWTITAPIRAAADPALVETLALNLKTLPKSRDAGSIPASDAAKFGLAPAARTVKLWGESAGAPLATLEIGSVSRDFRYVRNTSFPTIDVVESRSLSPLELTPKAWRDRAVFRIPTFQVERIETTRAEGTVALERANDEWRIVKPWTAPAEASSVESVLASLTSLRVLNGEAGFVAHEVADFAPYGLDKPVLTVSLAPSGGREPERMEIGKPAPRPEGAAVEAAADLRFARRGGGSDVLVVDARPFVGFGASPLDLRSKLVGRIQFPRVDFVSIAWGNDEIALTRGPRGWFRLKPAVDEADSASVAKLVRALADLQASEVFPPGKAPAPGLGDDVAVVRVWQDTAAARSPDAAPTGPPRMTIRIGARDAGKKSVYVQAEDEPNLLAVPDALLAAVPKGSLAFRSRRVLALGSNLVDKLAIEGGPIRYVIQAPPKPSPKGWRIAVPADAPVDEESLGRLLMLIGDMRVDTLVSEKGGDPKNYGFDKPWRVLTWSLRPEPGGTVPPDVSLVVGKVADPGLGTRYAKLTGSDPVFTLGPDQAATLDVEWRDRDVLLSDINRVRALRVRWLDVEQTLTPVDDPARNVREWRVSGPIPGVGMDTRNVPRVLGALARVRAVKFLQFDGPIPPATGLVARPKLSIELFETDAERPKRLRIGSMSPDGYLYATNAEGDTGPVFHLPLGGWDELARRPPFDVDPASALKP